MVPLRRRSASAFALVRSPITTDCDRRRQRVRRDSGFSAYGQGGWGTGSSEDAATQKALADCTAETGDVCQMAGGMHNGCAAYAIDPLTSRWHGDAGDDPAIRPPHRRLHSAGRYQQGNPPVLTGGRQNITAAAKAIAKGSVLLF
jgi:hypothetical protein